MTDATDLAPPSEAPALSLGAVYTAEQLATAFGFRPYYLRTAGGMIPVRRWNALLLITNAGHDAQFEYDDYWDGDDLIYTGRGLKGDQVLGGANQDVAEKARLRRDITAFANSQGGFLVFGVKDGRGLPAADRTVGMAASTDFPEHFGGYPSACEPTVGWAPKNPPIRLPAGGAIHVVHISPGRRRPHAVCDRQSSPGLFAMPVHGGPITTLLAGETGIPQGNQFLAVDDTNVYVLEGYSLVRIPKDGGPATLVNETGATVVGATALGGLVYWTETVGSPGAGQPTAVKSAPLLGNTITTIGIVTNGPSGGIANLGVTSTMAFLGLVGLPVSDFPLGGLPASGPTLVDAGPCSFLASDTDAIYCPGVNAMNLRIASDGTVSPLGPCVSCTFLVSDDSYVYWVDSTLVGAIVKAPKAGGGTFTAIASDTTPTAIGVDGMAVYWTDEGGYFKSIPK